MEDNSKDDEEKEPWQRPLQRAGDGASPARARYGRTSRSCHL